MSHISELAAAIPAFNEEPYVGEVVRGTLARLEKVVVVDDGSRDETAMVAKAAGAEVLVHDCNRGKGAALRTAFSYLVSSGFDAVLTLDADGQHLPEEIPRLVEVWRGGADLVLGTRDHLFPDMVWVRRASNTLSSRLISIVAGISLADVQTGFRIYSTALLDATGFPGNRFEAESAVVVLAAQRGYRISTVQVGLGYADGLSTSHYRPVMDSMRIAGAVVRARLERSDAKAERH